MQHISQPMQAAAVQTDEDTDLPWSARMAFRLLQQRAACNDTPSDDNLMCPWIDALPRQVAKSSTTLFFVKCLVSCSQLPAKFLTKSRVSQHRQISSEVDGWLLLSRGKIGLHQQEQRKVTKSKFLQLNHAYNQAMYTPCK